MRKTLFAVVAAMLLVGLLAACGGDDDEDSADAEAQLCEDLQAFDTAVAGLAALDANATVDQVEEAWAGVQEAFEEVEQSAGDVEAARLDDLDAAYDNLDQALGDINDDTVIADAVTAIQADAASIDAAWDQLFASVNCTA